MADVEVVNVFTQVRTDFIGGCPAGCLLGGEVAPARADAGHGRTEGAAP